MSLRDKMIGLSDELWEQAKAAAERHSNVEASVKRAVSNDIRVALGMDARENG